MYHTYISIQYTQQMRNFENPLYSLNNKKRSCTPDQ